MSIQSIICDLDPVSHTDVPGPDSPEAAILLRDLLAGVRPRPRPRIVTSGVALGALAAVAAVVLAAALLPGSPARPTSAAGATFERLATVAANQPAATRPGPGQYQYTESDEAYADCTYGQYDYCYLSPEHRQIWVADDGSGRLRETFGNPAFVSGADEAAWVKSGSPAISTAPSDTAFGPGGLTDGPVDLASLPTDPAALGDRLRARKIEGGPPGPAEDFVQIGDLLRETDASPALRAAIYQVASTIPGVVLLGTIDDHSGRSGLGLGYLNKSGAEAEYIFDPATSALLGEQTVAARPDVGAVGNPAGAVLDWAVYLSSGVVGSLSATPTGSAPPPPPLTCTSPSGTGSNSAAPTVGTSRAQAQADNC